MVNKREKTRSLVYQMKEEIFHQEAALAELEDGELSTEQLSKTEVVPLPKYCHHSTGTVYDRPDDILRTAQLFEERGQMLDRRNSSLSLLKTSTPIVSKSRLATDVFLTRSLCNQQYVRPNQTDADGIMSSPAASRSPIQQLFREKMEGLESGSWAVCSLEVKTDSTNNVPSNMNHDTSVMPAVSAELLNTDNYKLSKPMLVGHNDQKDKSASSEQIQVSDVQINDNTAKPIVTATAALHVKPELDSLINAEHDSDNLHVETVHADKVRASKQTNNVNVDTVNAQNMETVKANATRSTRHSAQKRCLKPAKTDLEKEYHSPITDSDTVPWTRTRRRMSKEQSDTEKVNDMQKTDSDKQMPVADFLRKNKNAVIPAADTDSHITAELNFGQSQRSRLSRSARKARSGEQVDDSSDILTQQPTVTKSLRRKRVESSSRGSSDNGKLREQVQVCIQDVSESISNSVLQRESLADEKHKETSVSNRQKVPLQDSSALNIDTDRESITQQMSKISPEATDSTCLTTPVPLNLETSNSLSFHLDNFRMDSSENTSAQNQCMTSLRPLTSVIGDSKKLVTSEAEDADDGAAVNETQLVNPNSTSQLNHVNSSNHQESGNILDSNLDAFLPKSPVTKSENVKECSLSLSRSRTEAQLNVCEVNTAVEHYDDDAEKDNRAKEDGLRKKPVRQRWRRMSKVDVDDESVSESHVMNQTDIGGNASQDEDVFTVSNKERITSHISTNKDVTELPVSTNSDSLPSLKTLDTHVELTGSLLVEDIQAGDSVSPAANEGSKLVTGNVTGVDNLQTSLESAVSDGYISPRSLAPNLVKLDTVTSNLHSRKTAFWNDSTLSILPMEDHGKSAVSNVGLQLSDLARMTSASSRKRAAHLMAGCRHRTVGVKKPSLMSDQPMEVDAGDKPPVSERLPFGRADLDSYKSPANKCNHPSPARRRPVLQTDSNTCRLEESSTNSSDQFFKANPPVLTDVNTEYASCLNCSTTEDLGKGEVLKSKLMSQYQPGVVTDSRWKEEKNDLHEQPQLMKHNSVGSGGFSGSMIDSRETLKTSSTSSSLVVSDSRRELLRAQLLRKFRPFQLTVSESIRRRVQDGLKLLSSIRAAPTICSHTRQKLADYLNQSNHQRNNEPAACIERLPLRPIDDKRDQTDSGGDLLRRQMPARSHRRVYSEWEYVSGDEFTSPMISDVDSNSDSDYSVNFEDLASSNADVRSSSSVARTRDRRLPTVQH